MGSRAPGCSTARDGFLLSLKDEFIDLLCEVKYFGNFCLTMGYHQINQDENAVSVKVFRIKYGSSELTVFMLGLINGLFLFMLDMK